MLEKALKGTRKYWTWITFLFLVIIFGMSAYSQQRWFGLTVTGMDHNMSWGLYRAQFTFLVGIAASAMIVVLPYSLHNFKAFGKIVIISEFLAASATLMCLLFVLADMGRPDRILNVLLYPHVHSMMFWDLLALNSNLFISLIIGWGLLGAERKEVLPPTWLKPVIYLSFPLVIGMLTVTAILHGVLPYHNLWFPAAFIPRFLVSSFASGASLLILLALIFKKTTGFEVGSEAREKLAVLATYAGVTNFFLIGTDFFTVFYSNPVPLMRFSLMIGLGSVAVLLIPALRTSSKWLPAACAGLVISIWLNNGVGYEMIEYSPTLLERTITLGIWAIGVLLLTILLKVAVTVKGEISHCVSK